MRQTSLKRLGFFLLFFLPTATACRQKRIMAKNTKPTHTSPSRKTTEVDSKKTPRSKNRHASELQSSVATFIMGSPEDNCTQIKKDPRLSELYGLLMGSAQEPTPEDVQLIRIAAVALTDLDTLKLDIGEKITHPAFKKYPNLKPFLRDRIVQYDPSFSSPNIEKPLNKEGIRAINQFRNALLELFEACNKSLGEENQS